MMKDNRNDRREGRTKRSNLIPKSISWERRSAVPGRLPRGAGWVSGRKVHEDHLKQEGARHHDTRKKTRKKATRREASSHQTRRDLDRSDVLPLPLNNAIKKTEGRESHEKDNRKKDREEENQQGLDRPDLHPHGIIADN